MAALSYQRLDFSRADGDTLASNRVVLDKGGPTYRMRLRYRQQSTSWLFDLSTTAGVRIVSSAWVRDRTNCLLGIVMPGRPRGAIIAYDPKRRGDPGSNAWTLDGVLFLYLPGGFAPELFTLYQTAVA